MFINTREEAKTKLQENYFACFLKKLKTNQKDMELRKAAEERKKDKQEEHLARERVRQQIAQDRYNEQSYLKACISRMF